MQKSTKSMTHWLQIPRSLVDFRWNDPYGSEAVRFRGPYLSCNNNNNDDNFYTG